MNRFVGNRMLFLAWLYFWVFSVAVRIELDDKNGDVPALTSGAFSDEEERKVDEALMTLLAARHSSSNKMKSDFPDAQAAVALGLADDLRALRHSRRKSDEDVDGQVAAESASTDEDSPEAKDEVPKRSKQTKREPKMTPNSQRADKALNEVKTRDSSKDKAKPAVMEKGEEAVEQSTETGRTQKEAEEAVSAAASVVSRNAVRASTASTAAVAEADKLSDKLRAATASAAEAKQLTEKLRDDAIVAARAREKHSHKGRRHTKESDGAKDEANSSDLAVYRDLLLRYEAMRLRQDLQKVDTGSAKSKGSLLRRLERLELERDIQDSTLDDKRRRSAIELNREAIRIRQARKALLGTGVSDVDLIGDGSREHEVIKGGSQLQLSAETIEEDEKGHCSDEDARCPAWKAAKECNNNREWMQEHCRKSCGTCPGDVAYLSMKGKGSNRQVKMKKMHIKELLDFLSDSASQSQTLASPAKKASSEGTKPDDDGVVVGVFAKKEHLKQLSKVHAAPQPESKKQAPGRESVGTTDEPVAETVKVAGKNGLVKHDPPDVAATNNHPGRQQPGEIVAEVVRLAKDIEGGTLVTKPTKREDDKRARGEREEEGAKEKKETEVVAADEDATENSPVSAAAKPSRAQPQAVKESKVGLKGTDLLKERWHENQSRERSTDADAGSAPKEDNQEQGERAPKGSRNIHEEAESVANVLDDINENNMGLESTNLLKHRRQERSQKRADEANAKTRTTNQKDKDKAQVKSVEASVDKRGQSEREEDGGKNMNEETELVKSVVADEDDKDDNVGLEDTKALKEHQQDVKDTDGGQKDTKVSKEHSPEKPSGNDADQDHQQKRSKKEHMVFVGRSKEDKEGQREREDQVQKHVVEETEVVSTIPDDRLQKVADHEKGRLVAGLPKEKRGESDREKEERSATTEEVDTIPKVHEEREIEAEVAAPLAKDTRGHEERNNQEDVSTWEDRSVNASAKRKKRSSSNDLRLSVEDQVDGAFSAKEKNSSVDDSEQSRVRKVQGEGVTSPDNGQQTAEQTPELKAKKTHTEHLSKIEVDEHGKRAKVDTWQVTQTEGWVDPASNSTVTKITEDTTVLVGDSPRSKKLLEEVEREQKERLKDLKVQHKQAKKQLKKEHEKTRTVEGSAVPGVVESKDGADGDAALAIPVLRDSRKPAGSDAAEQQPKKKQTQNIKKSKVSVLKGLKKATSGDSSTDSNVSSDRSSTKLHQMPRAVSGESAETDEAVASSTDAASGKVPVNSH
eukprot:TRINITY_DN7930_c0_g1_i1.p1 TRINITY_DN7930_c0_g1~~TRINITY_DN7930_c0_g1_i1.p1  ORF type:complete len:1257 (-),score=292.66 TRINITY_DN7930_c0_g1_i1:99-3869(-)